MNLHTDPSDKFEGGGKHTICLAVSLFDTNTKSIVKKTENANKVGHGMVTSKKFSTIHTMTMHFSCINEENKCEQSICHTRARRRATLIKGAKTTKF